MGVASLILGILALIVAWVPCVGIYALLFSVIGLILGAVGISAAKKSGKGKGLSVAGLVCNVIATAIALIWFFLIAKAADEVSSSSFADTLNKLSQEVEKSKSESTGLDKAFGDLTKQLNKAADDATKQLEKAKTDLEKAAQ